MQLASALVILLQAGPAQPEAQPAPGEPPAARAASAVQVAPALGFAWFDMSANGRHLDASGLALELHVDARLAPWFGLGATLTWGLTDWDRARAWIDQGNRAAQWTTKAFADVEAWARGGTKEQQALRYMGAIFADFFLVLSYAAVPACYAGSLGGATSHLQLDVTGTFHLAEGSIDAWGELGVGATALPLRFEDWRHAFGPLAGVGMRIGWLRIGARALWSPPSFNSAGVATVVTGAFTVGFVL
ncbi:MAG TPA: hypothetical protein VFR85_13090 [Anaeromyxobacteraceae bacterium]|nr:hypothetical protein [Anaeromyxobacteraceae bacterium]